MELGNCKILCYDSEEAKKITIWGFCRTEKFHTPKACVKIFLTELLSKRALSQCTHGAAGEIDFLNKGTKNLEFWAAQLLVPTFSRGKNFFYQASICSMS